MTGDSLTRYFFVLFFAAFTACTSNSTSDGENDGSTQQESPAYTDGNCVLQQYTLTMQDAVRTYRIVRSNDQIDQIVIDWTNKPTQLIEFNYTEDGTLRQVLDTLRALDIQFHFDAAGQLDEMYGTGGDTIRLTRNNDGTVSRQALARKGFPKRTQDIVYDNEGRPLQATVYDQYGDHQLNYYYSFDDRPNPFQGLSAFGNNFERSYNWAVGNCKNNIRQVVIEYVQGGARNMGKVAKAGQRDTIDFEYQYNEYGYPVQIDMHRAHLHNEFKLTYTCE